MRRKLVATILPALCACTNNSTRDVSGDLVGMDSFALAARYGTPTGYHIEGEYMQLNYGSTAAGCRLIVLIDQDQRVAGWATAGTACVAP